MMQPLVIRIPDEYKRLLKLKAKKERVSIAEIVRRAIKAYLQEKQT